MTNPFKASLKYLLDYLGYEIRKHRGRCSDPFQVQKQLCGETRPFIFDVGANRGTTVDRYNALFDATIYAFEPYPPLYRQLEDKYAADKNIRVVNKAVGSTSEPQRFHIDDNDEINSLLRRLESRRRYGQAKGDITVQSTTIDHFVDTMSVDHIHILKLDIEGGEMEALRGGYRTLSRHMVGLIYLEVGFYRRYEGEGLFREVDSYLNQLGYTLFNLYNLYRIPDNGQLSICDALYVSENMRKDIDAKLKLVA